LQNSSTIHIFSPEDAVCQREGCRHSKSDHIQNVPITVTAIPFDQHCNLCGCDNFQLFAIREIHTSLDTAGLNQQIEQLEKELVSSSKEISSLKKQLDIEKIEKKTLQGILTNLSLELDISNHVKRNLKNLVDKQENNNL